MRKLMQTVSVLALCAGLTGCASVTSAMGGNTTDTGESWYVRSTGFFGMVFSSKVFYCPAPANGPAQCKEAKMVETPSTK